MIFLEETLLKLQKDHPQCGGLVVFDSDCVLCNRSVKYLLKADKGKRLLYTSFDSPLLAVQKTTEGVNNNTPLSLIFVYNNNIYLESDAALKIAETIGLTPVLVRIGKLIPRFLRNYIYRVIARYRYSWFGKTNHCMVPSREDAERFY
jgi:predicted DCC family thiol-disulfide oxidoreductase YuxK